MTPKDVVSAVRWLPLPVEQKEGENQQHFSAEKPLFSSGVALTLSWTANPLMFLEFLLCVRHSRTVCVCVCTSVHMHAHICCFQITMWENCLLSEELTFSQAEQCIKTIVHQFGDQEGAVVASIRVRD